MTNPVDGAAVVAKHWPTNGPHTEESLASAAEAIGELVRYMAHATIGTEVSALPYACGGYTVVGRLSTAATSQEQVLRQIAKWADSLSVDSSLRHDKGADARVCALEAAAYLYDAAINAGRLGHSLEVAQSLLGHLYHDDSGN
jgi:hypothetical protein